MGSSKVQELLRVKPRSHDPGQIGRDAGWHGVRVCASRVPETTGSYTPRDPTQSVLFHIVRDHFETLRVQAATLRDGEGLPRFVEREFREFLTCGCLALGFARFSCDACGHDRLVPFSCCQELKTIWSLPPRFAGDPRNQPVPGLQETKRLQIVSLWGEILAPREVTHACPPFLAGGRAAHSVADVSAVVGRV